jgi:hypothetical protein
MLFQEPLLSNGCCIFAYLAVVTQKRIYMLQYVQWACILVCHSEGERILKISVGTKRCDEDVLL